MVVKVVGNFYFIFTIFFMLQMSIMNYKEYALFYTGKFIIFSKTKRYVPLLTTDSY